MWQLFWICWALETKRRVPADEMCSSVHIGEHVLARANVVQLPLCRSTYFWKAVHVSHTPIHGDQAPKKLVVFACPDLVLLCSCLPFQNWIPDKTEVGPPAPILDPSEERNELKEIFAFLGFFDVSVRALGRAIQLPCHTLLGRLLESNAANTWFAIFSRLYHIWKFAGFQGPIFENFQSPPKRKLPKSQRLRTELRLSVWEWETGRGASHRRQPWMDCIWTQLRDQFSLKYKMSDSAQQCVFWANWSESQSRNGKLSDWWNVSLTTSKDTNTSHLPSVHRKHHFW